MIVELRVLWNHLVAFEAIVSDEEPVLLDLLHLVLIPLLILLGQFFIFGLICLRNFLPLLPNGLEQVRLPLEVPPLHLGEALRGEEHVCIPRLLWPRDVHYGAEVEGWSALVTAIPVSKSCCLLRTIHFNFLFFQFLYGFFAYLPY